MQLRLLVALTLAGTTARADDVPAFDGAVHWQIEPTFRVGPVRLDGETVGIVGGALDLGLRLGRFAIVVDLSEMSVQASSAPALTINTRLEPAPAIAAGAATPAMAGSGGTMDRLGVTGRFYLGRVLDRDAVADVWVGGGVGREAFTWDAGGALSRTDVLVAIGATLGAHQELHTNERTWWGGMAVGLDVIYARRDDGMQPVACGGPCDVATRPSQLDRTIAFDMSIPFGK